MPLDKSALKQIIDLSNECLIVFDQTDAVIYWNEAFPRFWNISAVQLLNADREQVHDWIDAQVHEKGPSLQGSQGGFGDGSLGGHTGTRLKDGRMVRLREQQIELVPQGLCNLEIWSDISELSELYSELTNEHNLLLELVNNVPDQIYFKDRHSCFLRINPALALRYGLKNPAEAIGKSDADFYSPEHAQQTALEEQRIMESGEPVYNQIHHEHWEDGRESWNVSTKMPLRNAKGEVTGIVGISHDITEHKQREALIWQQANYDMLTGLANRLYFKDQMEHFRQQASRLGTKFTLMMIDLDHFKEINDSLGHDKGDELLVEVSSRLKAVTRESDLVARLGGDEFAIVIPYSSSSSGITHLAQKILDALHEPIDLSGHRVHISGSIGISSYPDDSQRTEELMRFADQAMYQAKGQGRASFAFFSDDLSESTARRLRLASDLREAIGSEQIYLVYQPVIEASSGQIVSAEVLCRWQHPVLGYIGPDEFIDIAESSGLIQPLEDSILDIALDQLVTFNQLKCAPIRLAINLSPAHLARDNQRIADLPEELDRLGLARNQITLEITENVLLNANDDSIRVLESLRSGGVMLSLDDFGTGYSALSYLMHFDIQQLKIDKTFVEDVDSSSSSRAVCRAIISLARALEMKVVGEGVETADQRDALIELGCDYLQGFFYSRGVEGKVLTEMLQAQSQRKSRF